MKEEIYPGDVENTIEQRIFIIRERRVMLDGDLAKLYQVKTKVLNQQVKRNRDRFPEDFMFQLNDEEFENLKSQIVTSRNMNRSQIVTGSQKHRDPRFLPYAFTEHGVAMLSSVLNSKVAIQMNIFVIRAFIKMRESLETYKDLALKIGKIEINHIQDRAMLRNIHSVVKHLLEEPSKPKRKMGFKTEE